MENLNNKITISGLISSEVVFSHEKKGEKFYKFFISSQRTSEVYDEIPCLISEVKEKEIEPGTEIYISGQIRTYNKHTDDGNKLEINVFVDDLFSVSVNDKNDAEIVGFICNKKYLRKTPLGRTIIDFMIAVNRPYGKSDYIPTISWGRTAERVSEMKVGTQIKVRGRLQSRTYFKKFEDGTQEERIAYELSASTVEVVTDEVEEEQSGNS